MIQLSGTMEAVAAHLVRFGKYKPSYRTWRRWMFMLYNVHMKQFFCSALLEPYDFMYLLSFVQKGPCDISWNMKRKHVNTTWRHLAELAEDPFLSWDQPAGFKESLIYIRLFQTSLMKPCLTFEKKLPPRSEMRTENYRLQDSFAFVNRI